MSLEVRRHGETHGAKAVLRDMFVLVGLVGAQLCSMAVPRKDLAPI